MKAIFITPAHLLIVLIAFSLQTLAQGVGINTSIPDPSAVLDVTSTTQGLLIPRMTESERDAISAPASGLLIYNTTTGCINLYSAGWKQSCFECAFNAPNLSYNSPVCEGNTLNLSATSVSGATYSWTGPNGFSSSDQNPSIASVTAAAAGTYTLEASVSGCIQSADVTVNISTIPSTPGSISGNSTPLIGQTGVSYSISTAPGATSYTWTVPSGASVASGQGTTAATIDFGTSSGDVCVTASNSCGTSSGSCLSISLVYPVSCKDIKDNNTSATDGMYTIDPDESGGSAPYSAYCDMTTDGGGWTLWAYMDHNGMVSTGTINTSSNNYMDATRYSTLYAAATHIRASGNSTDFYLSKSEASLGLCQDLSTSVPEYVSSYVVFGHKETSGCTLSGSDYSFMGLYSGGMVVYDIVPHWHIGSPGGSTSFGQQNLGSVKAEMYVR